MRASMWTEKVREAFLEEVIFRLSVKNKQDFAQ